VPRPALGSHDSAAAPHAAHERAGFMFTDPHDAHR
jgi:hypothetical protein